MQSTHQPPQRATTCPQPRVPVGADWPVNFISLLELGSGPEDRVLGVCQGFPDVGWSHVGDLMDFESATEHLDLVEVEGRDVLRLEAILIMHPQKRPEGFVLREVTGPVTAREDPAPATLND